MEAIEANTALIVIDVQVGLDEETWGQRNNPEAEANMARLLEAWRSSGRPLFHIKHNSQNPQSPLRAGSPGNEIKEVVRPQAGEPLIEKTVNSAFIGTDLEAQLRRAGVHAVVITGLTTNHCVDTSARMAGNLGFETYLVSDATATFDRTGPDGRWHSAEDVHTMTLVNLHGEFATVVTTDQVLEMAAVPH